MRIGILGGGNGAFAAAADLADQGHEVALWRRDRAACEALAASGGILRLIDAGGERTVRLARVTAEIGEAVRDAALVVFPGPAFAQEEVGLQLAPHLVDGQVVFLPPGSFGSVLMAGILRGSGSRAQVAFAEAGTLPYLARKRGADGVAISARAVRLPAGVFPLRLREHALGIVRQAYPAVLDAGDALSGALMNAGPIIHPPLILMNAGALEHFARWDIHKEGTQAATRRVMDTLDGERIALREHLGYGAPHFPLRDHYHPEAGEPWMYGERAHTQLVDSGDWNEHIGLMDHRYMREDVQQGLAFLVSVAAWAGVEAPVARALLALGSTVCGEDFGQTGRTLERLGLAKLSREKMRSLLTQGF